MAHGVNPHDPPKADGTVESAELASGGAPAAIPSATRWMLALGATLTMAVSYFDRQTLAAIAPRVSQALGIDSTGYGLLVSAFSLAYLVGSPLAGKLLDVVGARKGLLGAVVAWTVIAALHALVPSFGVLLVLRIGLGLAEAPSFPGATQTVHRALLPADRARGFGLLFTGSSIGALIAPFAAIALEKRYGWRVAFLVTAIAGLVWVPMWLALTRGKTVRSLLDQAPTKGPSKPASMLATLLEPAVLRACVVVLASAPMVGFVLNWSAKYLAAAEHVPQAELARYLWVPPILFDVGSLLFGHLASTFAGRPAAGRALFLVCGLLGASFGLVLVIPGPWAAMVIAGVALAGVAGLFAIFTADMLGRVPQNAVGTAGGITAAAQSLVYIVANPLVGKAVDASGSYSGSILVLSAIVLPGVIAWLVWPAPPRRDATA